MTMGEAEIAGVVRAYREGLERLFGDQLVRVTLYGSSARGERREDSDIDILCVLRSPFDYSDAIRRSSELTAELSLAHDVVLSRVFVSEEDMKSSNLPFFRNIRREGVAT